MSKGAPGQSPFKISKSVIRGGSEGIEPDAPLSMWLRRTRPAW